MVTSKSVEKNNEEWYNKTVQIFERSYRTDASFVISHIKSAQKKVLITHKYRGSQQFSRVEYSTQIY